MARFIYVWFSRSFILFPTCVAIDMALGFWQLLIPFGLQGGALSHIASPPTRDGEDTRMMEDEEGWRDEYTQWWFDFLQEKGAKGVSKDVWAMVSKTKLHPSLTRTECARLVSVSRICSDHRLQI